MQCSRTNSGSRQTEYRQMIFEWMFKVVKQFPILEIEAKCDTIQSAKQAQISLEMLRFRASWPEYFLRV